MKNIYPTPKVLNQFVLILILVFSGLVVNSQNIAITDSAEYDAEISAMLDVQSNSKGLLVPRLTTAQRDAIDSPAIGLLVYDTDNSGFFYFDGSDWLTISQMNTSGTGSALFAVLNAAGDTVFAVYNDGAKVTIPFGSKGKVGGFAVSGRTSTKDLFEDNYLYVTPDSTRITFDEGAKGKVGGFAVSGRTSSKAGTSISSIINLFPDNYFIGDSAGINTTGTYNNFIGYKAGAKNTSGSNNTFMGYKSGYNNLTGKNNIAMGYYAGYDLQESDYNVFIGDSVGRDNRTGDQNVYLGYNAGVSNIGGNQNIFIGYKAGFSNVGNTSGNDALDYLGSRNIFIGYEAGYVNTDGRFNVLVGQNAGRSLNASYNTIIGYNAGIDATAGSYNLFLGNDAGKNNSGGFNSFIGPQAGQNNTTGHDNTYVGHQSGLVNTGGNENTFIGKHSGRNNTGSGNVFIGYNAGHSETGSNLLYIDNADTSTPLIYGDFTANTIKINGEFEVYHATESTNLNLNGNTTSTKQIVFQESGTYKAGFGWQANDEYVFLYEGSTNSFVSKGGSIGLNTTTPSTYLHVDRNRDVVLSTANTGVFMIGSSTGANMVFDANEIMARTSGTTATNLLLNYEGGNIYLGNVSSTVYVQGTFTNTSDLRLKEKVESLTYGLSETLELNPVSFYWKDYKNLKKQVGFIAQELQKVLPELISETEDGYLSIDYIKIIPVVVNSIKEQQQQINKQQKQIDLLIKELEELKK